MPLTEPEAVTVPRPERKGYPDPQIRILGREMGELDVEAVRRAAVQGGLHEIYFNQTSRVV